MNFAEKCNRIFLTLNCSNSDIARRGGIDPSLISRYRTGSRQPGGQSSQLLMFCMGIVSYAQEKGLSDKLRHECGLTGLGNNRDELIAYLTEDKEKPQSTNKNDSHSDAGLFSEKLNILMNMFCISNIRLARVLNVDSSLISRFRNGLRTPLKNPPLMEKMCANFYKLARQNEMEQELSDLIGFSVSRFEYKDEFINNFMKWFSLDNQLYKSGTVDGFLEKLDNLVLVKMPELLPLNSILTDDVMQDISGVYIGIEGLRRAVIRFLGTIAMSASPGTLKLYSDQNMSWLSGDPGFLQKWTSLMYAVLIKKTHIKIIHNINRNLEEMLAGIEKWLPLYMSGMVEGFYRKSHNDPWFSHTVFVASKTAAICSCLAAGTEDTGVYHYYDTREQTAYCENQMNALMANAKPLIRVFNKNRAADYLLFTSELSKIRGTLKRLTASPSSALIPARLLERMLRRTGAQEEEINRILIVHADSVKQFERELKNGYVSEYMVFPSDEDLLAGRVILNISDTFAERTIFYTPDEYSEQIIHLIELLAHEHYDIVPIPECPFANIQIAVKENAGAVVRKTDKPVTVFWFDHPLMCKALGEYIDAFGQKIRLPITGRNELIKYLGKYIR